MLRNTLAMILCAVMLATALPIAVPQAAMPALAEEAPTDTPVPDETPAQAEDEPEQTPEPPTPAIEATPTLVSTVAPVVTPVTGTTPGPTEYSPTPTALRLFVSVSDVTAEGAQAVFTAHVDTDFTGELFYQWQRQDEAGSAGGAPWLDLPGETFPTLTVTGVDGSNYTRFLYRCRVSAGDTVVFSCAAAVTSADGLLAGEAQLLYRGSCGKGVFYAVYFDGVLKITGNGDISDYSSDFAPWYTSCRNNISTLVVESGVTGIGKRAMYGLTYLTGVSLPASVAKIGDGAFQGCSSLTNIQIPTGVSAIGEKVFSECERLSSVSLPDGLVQIGNSAFSGCKSLVSISLPAGVTAIDAYAFSECSTLRGVVLPSGVKAIGDGLFGNCINLASVSLPAGLTSIGAYAFRNTRLVEVDIPSGVTSIGDGAYMECVNLKRIVLPSGLTSLGCSLFEGCIRLPGVSLPVGLTSIGYHMFFGCEYLASISIPESVKEIGDGAFEGCKRITSVSLPAALTVLGGEAFSDCIQLKSMVIPDGVKSLSCTFYGCRNLASVRLPPQLTTIALSAFCDCVQLKSIDIPRSVTFIGEGSFDGCTSLTSVDVPPLVERIEPWAFRNCTNLAQITLPNVTAVLENAFDKCNRLKTVYFRGNKKEWSDLLLDMEPGNDVLKSVKLYFCLDSAGVTVPVQVYTGNDLTPKPTVEYRGTTLIEGTDYAVTGYACNINAGVATVAISGLGMYRGITSGTFTILPRDISLCVVSATGDTVPGADATGVSVAVIEGGQPLINLTDYIWSVSGDQVTIQGKGNYGGERADAIDTRPLLAEGTCGEGFTWRLYASGLLAIDGAGAMPDYDPGAEPWSAHISSITSVSVGMDVAPICVGAFSRCTALKEYLVATGNSAYRTIGGVLFDQAGTTLLHYPASRTDTAYRVPAGTERIASGALKGGALTSLNLPSSLTALSDDLTGLESLRAISVSTGNPVFCARGGVLFSADGTVLIRYPRGRSDVIATIPDGVTSIADGAFTGCEHISMLHVPASLAQVGVNAFLGVPGIEVRYFGCPIEWGATRVMGGNEAFLSAIRRYDLSSFAVAPEVAGAPYTGAAITPGAVVKRGNLILTPGIDYWITGYADNVEAGTASLFIEGAGEYIGTGTATFEITSPMVREVRLAMPVVTIGTGQSVTTIAGSVRTLPDGAVDESLSWISDNPAIAKVDAKGKITGVKPGSCFVTASSVANPLASGTIEVIVVPKGKGVTGIKLGAQSLVTYLGQTAQIAATVAPVSAFNPTIIWVSSDESVVRVSGGAVTGVGYGTAIITATASSGYAASCTVRVARPAASISLEPTSRTLGVGETLALACSVEFDDLSGTVGGDPVTFTSGNTKVATVTPSGLVKGVKAGTTFLMARTASGLTAQCAVAVLSAPSRFSILAPRAILGAGECMALEAVFSAGSGGGVTWSLPVAQRTLAEIDPVTGVLTAGLTPGSITPTARSYNGKTAAITLSIVPAPFFVALAPSMLTLCAGDRSRLNALLPSGSTGAITYSSDDPGVASVDAQGVVTAGSAEGETVLRAETYNRKRARCLLTVVSAPTSIELDMGSTELGAGESCPIRVTAAPADVCITLAFSSNNPKVASVSLDGVVRGVKAGSAVITVTSYNGITREIAVTVLSAPSSVSMSIYSQLGLGETAEVEASANAGACGKITITSSNAEVVRVNPDNTVTALKLGDATITATAYNGKRFSKLVSVLPAPTDGTMRLLVDDGYGGFVHGTGDDAHTYTVARGDWTRILLYYFDEPQEGEDDDRVPVQQCAGSVTVDATAPEAMYVDEASGKLTFVKNGPLDISLTTYNGIKRTLRFNIIDPPAKIALETEGPAMCAWAEYQIIDTDRNENILQKYSFFHYTITSSNASAIRVIRYSGGGYESPYGVLVGAKKASSTITVKLFNGVSCKKTVSVRRNLYHDSYQPHLDDIDEGYFNLYITSAEILAPNKVTVEFYIVNNSEYYIRQLYDFEIGFVVHDNPLCYRYYPSYTFGVAPYSIKKMSITFTGNAVDPEIAQWYDLGHYLDDPDTSGWFDCY